MKKHISFTYNLTKAGVAAGSISIDNQKATFEVNNVSNPLFDLLKGMVSLIFEPSHIWGEENMCWVDWYSDHMGVKWVLSTQDGHTLDIKVIEYTDLFDESTGEVKIHEQCDFLQLYSAIIQELDQLLKHLGLLNYEQKWQKDEFPLTYFLLLKKHLIEKGHWIPSTTNPNSNLNDEIDLLMA
jgi:hypothetical protein